MKLCCRSIEDDFIARMRLKIGDDLFRHVLIAFLVAQRRYRLYQPNCVQQIFLKIKCHAYVDLQINIYDCVTHNVLELILSNFLAAKSKQKEQEC